MRVYKNLAMTYKRTISGVVLAILGLTAIATVRAEIIEQILVKVNGEIFTKSDLEQRQVAALRQKGQQIDLKGDAANQQLRKALDEITPQIMVEAVDEMLLVQRGKELGYKLSDEQFKGVLDNIKKENKLENDEQFQAALKAENMTMADLRRNLERSMIVQKVQQNEVMSKIGISEDEARRYYDSHMNEFTTPQSITLREILMSVPTDSKGLNVGVDEAAKSKAEDIHARVTKGGENFEKLAAEVSDAPSKANAGLIGPISLNDLSADLRKMVDGMKPGDVTPVTRMSRGYQIYKLETATTAQTMPFDQAREQIGERVFTDKRKVEYQKYLEKLRTQAIIEWKNPDVKKAFDVGVKAQAPSPSL
jgi:parvulin-like peptidyl-prolyl isomerase